MLEKLSRLPSKLAQELRGFRESWNNRNSKRLGGFAVRRMVAAYMNMSEPPGVDVIDWKVHEFAEHIRLYDAKMSVMHERRSSQEMREFLLRIAVTYMDRTPAPGDYIYGAGYLDTLFRSVDAYEETAQAQGIAELTLGGLSYVADELRTMEYGDPTHLLQCPGEHPGFDSGIAARAAQGAQDVKDLFLAA